MYESLTQNLTSPQRITMIRQVYDFLYKKLQGAVTLENLGKVFDARKHPEVLAKAKTEEEVFTEYIRSWGKVDPFQVISEDEFLAFYCVTCI